MSHSSDRTHDREHDQRRRTAGAGRPVGPEAFARFSAALDRFAESPPERWPEIAAKVFDDDSERVWALRLAREELLDDESVPADRGPLRSASAAELLPELVGEISGDEDGEAVSGDPLPATLGDFRVLHRLGSGGMGEVFLGVRQRDGFEQRAAVKRMGPRRLDAEAESRFRREREILAGLEHPGIARLIDGGVSDDGRPYYAMELIDGRPITEACDDQRLTLEERIEVFLQVCDAVAAAHRHLVLHRDLKPANILMTAERRIKLVDFGIAKPLVERPEDAVGGSESTVLAFTPEYAAPEQRLGRATSTATDIYALGLVLYEVLIGISAHRASSDSGSSGPASIPEVPEAHRALDRFETNAPGDLAELAARRGTSPGRLRRELRGDLGNILGVALRPEPGERYPSVEALNSDLRAYLERRPVSATRSNAWYRVRKLTERHRWTVAAAGVALVALALGAVGTLSQRDRARSERDRALEAEAEAAAINRFLVEDLLGSLSPGEAAASQVSLGELTDQAARRLRASLGETPEIRRAIHLRLAEIYLEQGNGPAALEQITAASASAVSPDEEGERRAALLRARALVSVGEFDAAQEIVDRLRRARVAGGEAAVTAGRKADVPFDLIEAEILRQRGDWFRAEQLLRRAIGELGSGSREQLQQARGQLSAVLMEQRRAPEAIELLRELLEQQTAELGEDHPDTLLTSNTLTQALDRAEHRRQALENAERTFERARRVLGEDHPQTLASMNRLGIAQRDFDLERAAETFREIAILATRRFGERSPRAITARMNEGVVLADLGRYAEAEELYRETHRLYVEVLGEDHPSTVRALSNLESLLRRMERTADADRMVERLIELGRSEARKPSPDPTRLSDFASRLAQRFPQRYRDLDEALEYSLRAEELSGGRSFAVQSTLAQIRRIRGENQEAFEAFERVLESPEAVYTFSLERDLIDLGIDSGDVARAERALLRIQQLRAETRPPGDRLHSVSHRRLSELYRRAERLDAALRSAHAAVERAERCCAAQSAEAAFAVQQRGRVLTDLGRFDEARAAFDEAIDRLESLPEGTTREVEEVREDLDRMERARRAASVGARRSSPPDA
ncbi:MAG: serine/threonine protein kinase [Acidobacteria bacterium]|nr:MAG: serine/threonine protein kinase [Acidobacteriota bacterium]REK03831.1 MAG: serine/threonine protein kinase [Acidobacteriota bacterium]